jgi:hypothetical protein
MDGAIYLLSRRVLGDNGENFVQNVTVYAESPDQAREIVNDQFTRLREASRSKEHAYLPTPSFNIEKVSLKEPKMITAGVTI